MLKGESISNNDVEKLVEIVMFRRFLEAISFQPWKFRLISPKEDNNMFVRAKDQRSTSYLDYYKRPKSYLGNG